MENTRNTSINVNNHGKQRVISWTANIYAVAIILKMKLALVYWISLICAAVVLQAYHGHCLGVTRSRIHTLNASTNLTEQCECGVPNSHQKTISKIVNGVPTGSIFPWMVSLINGIKLIYFQLTITQSFFCGGTLISPYHVMTASHCVDGFFKRFPQFCIVQVGQHNLSPSQDSPQNLHNASEIFVHPDYNKTDNRYDYDIAIIKLSRPVTFTPNIRPICIPFPDVDIMNKSVTAVGWGRTSSGGNISLDLLAANLTSISSEDCQEKYYFNFTGLLTRRMMCASDATGIKGTCQGDSGGPLQLNCGSFITIVGVTNFAVSCGLPSFPTSFALVSAYHQWIKVTTDNAICSKICP